MNDKFDVVWWRRPRKPFVPAEFHQNDLNCITRENRALHNAIPLVIANNAWWINPYDSIKLSDYERSACELIDANMSHHVYLNAIKQMVSA